MDAEVEKRLEKIDRKLNATADLVRAGIQLVTKIGKLQKENGDAVKALIDAQMRTETMVERLAAAQQQTEAAQQRTEAAQQRTEAAQQRTERKLERLISALLRAGKNGR